jgi:16S rRNA U1498 N3-methylase RsmE
MNRASIFFISAKLKKGPLTLQGAEFHFMVRVSQHQTGETVTLFDGTGSGSGNQACFARRRQPDRW